MIHIWERLINRARARHALFEREMALANALTPGERKDLYTAFLHAEDGARAA